MHPPIAVTPDLFTPLDLQPVIAELLTEARRDPAHKASRTLVKSPELSIVVIALCAGGSMMEHAAPGPVTIVPLHGRVSFRSPDADAPEAQLQGTTVLAMGAGKRHAVTAEGDAAFMVVLGRNPAA